MRQDTLLLFDLDGTLWDSTQQVAESWNFALRASGLRAPLPVITAQDMRSVMGKPMDEIARALLPGLNDDDRNRVFQECEDYEVDYVTTHSGVLYPDVESTLAVLKEKGYVMGVVSNCQIGYINAFYVSTGLGRYFSDMEEWGRTGKPKAENIRLVMERNGFEKAWYIGDTKGDRDSAADAGIPFVFASYGFGSVSDPDAEIQRFAELTEMF